MSDQALKELRALREEVAELRHLLANVLRLDPDALLSAPNAAALLGISTRTFYDYVSQGTIPMGRKIGSRRRWTRQELRSAVEAVPSPS